MSLLGGAEAVDSRDPLAPFRARFALDPDLIYLDGNSLGPPVRSFLDGTDGDVLTEWRRDLVLGWERWLDLGLETGDMLAPVIGARAGEVVVTDQTSVNLYKLSTAAVRSLGRTRIVTERTNFPSDRYVLDAVADAEGIDLVAIDDARDHERLEAALGDGTALLVLTHVDYRTGSMHDGGRTTELAHRRGAVVMWDLAHSAGAVPVDLDGWEADLAVGCTYKYLNGGPGAPGFLYVRRAHQRALRQPIEAWFGHADQFGFHDAYEPAPSVRRFQTGTPPILSLAAARAGVSVTVEAGMPSIHAKSVSLTTTFLEALDALVTDVGTTVVTPTDPRERGSHVAVAHEHALSISQALRTRRVIVDFRTPDIVRFGFAPLYNTHVEAVRAAEILAEILDSGSWRDHSGQRSGVT